MDHSCSHRLRVTVPIMRRRHDRRLALHRLLPVLLLALVAGLVTAAPSEAIIGGQFDGNVHPYSGAVDTPGPRSGGFASGVLISPTVFLTAGHVIRSAFEDQGLTRASVTFDPIAGDASTYYVGTVHTNPAFDPQPADAPGDLGVIVFDEAVTTIAPAALPTAGLLDQIGPQALRNATFDVVGYGISRFLGGSDGGGQPRPDLTSGGTRNAAQEDFLSITQEWLRVRTRNDATVCAGDSGSPNLLGDSGVVVSITVGSLGNCNTTNWTIRLDTPSARTFLGQYVALP